MTNNSLHYNVELSPSFRISVWNTFFLPFINVHIPFKAKASHQTHMPKLENGSRSTKEAEPEAAILRKTVASTSLYSTGCDDEVPSLSLSAVCEQETPRGLNLRQQEYDLWQLFLTVASSPVFQPSQTQYHFDKFIFCWNESRLVSIMCSWLCDLVKAS